MNFLFSKSNFCSSKQGVTCFPEELAVHLIGKLDVNPSNALIFRHYDLSLSALSKNKSNLVSDQTLTLKKMSVL